MGSGSALIILGIRIPSKKDPNTALTMKEIQIELILFRIWISSKYFWDPDPEVNVSWIRIRNTIAMGIPIRL